MNEHTKLAASWIREFSNDARKSEPDVGIFPNEELACELERAASFIESYSAADYDALVGRVAELEREMKARIETDRELINSLQRSSQNLNEYATEHASWDLPMSGPDLGTRDVIKELRAMLDCVKTRNAQCP